MYGESKNAPSYDISVVCLSLSYRQRKQKNLGSPFNRNDLKFYKM